MKRLTVVMFALMSAFALHAQQPSPDPDTLKNPVKQIDPEVKQPPADIHYVDEMTRIAATELPGAVLDSLKKAEPLNWEKSVVYRDKQQKNFLIHVRDGGNEKTYRFDQDGRRIKTLDQPHDTKRNQQ
jgi:hypothetical protein